MPQSYQGGSVLFAIVPMGMAIFLACLGGVIPWVAGRNGCDRDRPLVRLDPTGITIYQRPPVAVAWADVADAWICSGNRAVSLCLTLVDAGPMKERRFNLALLADQPRDLLAAIHRYPAYRGR